MITSRYTFFTILVGLTLCGSLGSRAATPGLPFTEDFSNTALQDTARSTAQWDTLHGTMGLARRRPGYADYAAMQGTNVSTHPANTQGIAVGDLNGDGHLDVIVVNLDASCGKLA